MSITRFLKSLLPAVKSPLERAGIRPGLYHYMREADGGFVRFHLRVDTSGNGLLLANAAAAAQLRVSGVIIAKGLLEGESVEAIVGQLLRSFYGVTSTQATADIAQVRKIINDLASPGDNYPILNLADPSFSPQATPLDKPLSADVPLAMLDSMRPILQRLWDLGIPHVTILADAGVDAAPLVSAVERASDLGMITGVRGAGSVLARGTLIRDLAAAGLDHLDVYYLSHVAEIHDALLQPGDQAKAIEAILAAQQQEICPVPHVALLQSTLRTIAETLRAIAERGVHNACFFALATEQKKQTAAAPLRDGPLDAEELVQAAQVVEAAAETHGMRMLWFPTVQFDPALGLAEQVGHGPRCGGDTAIRVESDGAVIPPRGPFRSAGNLLHDSWETISQSEAFRRYRQRLQSDTHCDHCPGLAICAADCPRHPAGWAAPRG
jgi:radical SAM protein with 4Fe4S-binding SPASM domain